MTRRGLIGAGLALWAWAAAGCKTGPSANADQGTLTDPSRPGSGPYMDKPLPVATPLGVPIPMGPGVPVLARGAWTSVGVARPKMINPMNGVRRITVHHEGATVFTATGQADAARRIESIRRGHVGRATDGQPWADIGYHYIVDPAGRVWEGRSVQYQGAHVHLKNESNLGIVVLGNFEKQAPTPAALATLDRFLAEQMRRYRVPIANVLTHRELNPTACPGRSLQSHMVAARAVGGTLRLALGGAGADSIA
ncbi:MAG: peptidoglycan recognition family protein [Phycisphaerales bacterium]